MGDPGPKANNPHEPDWLDPAHLRPVFEGKRIFVGITGGIAVYKVCTVVSRLAQSGADVTVAMTEPATHFVAPLTFQALSGNVVYTSAWEHVESQDPQHIALADRADAALVAPCTMHSLADLVQGRTDTIVTLILSAVDRARCPVLLAPAMNDRMWAQPSNQRNVEQAQHDGFTLIGPGDGWQACRHSGTGRMSEPADLLRALSAALSGSLGADATTG